jgi:hypothetical protein
MSDQGVIDNVIMFVDSEDVDNNKYGGSSKEDLLSIDNGNENEHPRHDEDSGTGSWDLAIVVGPGDRIGTIGVRKKLRSVLGRQDLYVR